MSVENELKHAIAHAFCETLHQFDSEDYRFSMIAEVHVTPQRRPEQRYCLGTLTIENSPYAASTTRQ